MRLTSSPLAEFARGMSLPVFEEAADAARLRAMRADAAAVCDYGMMLSAAVLESFPRGALNIHPSLLPRWRGPEPIIRAILKGDSDTGVCIMQLDEGMDTGAILLRERVAISPTITGGELSDALAKIGARLLLRALSENPAPQAQSGEATHARRLPPPSASWIFACRRRCWRGGCGRLRRRRPLLLVCRTAKGLKLSRRKLRSESRSGRQCKAATLRRMQAAR